MHVHVALTFQFDLACFQREVGANFCVSNNSVYASPTQTQ